MVWYVKYNLQKTPCFRDGMSSAAIIGSNCVRYDAETSQDHQYVTFLRMTVMFLHAQMSDQYQYVTMVIELNRKLCKIQLYDPYEYMCILSSKDATVKNLSVIMSIEYADILLQPFEKCQFKWDCHLLACTLT